MATMMACGHAANATTTIDGQSFPCCAICAGLSVSDPNNYRRIAPTPDLIGRIALCTYTGCKTTQERKGDTHYGEFGLDGRSFAPSDTNLPFFKHWPGKPNDEYFCGCWGWD